MHVAGVEPALDSAMTATNRDTAPAPTESDAGEEDPGASLGELPTASAIRGEQRAHDRALHRRGADDGADAVDPTAAPQNPPGASRSN